MRVAVLGTGMVGRTLSTKLVSLGHAVTMGARQAGSDSAVAWASSAGELGAEGSFGDAAAAGELVVNATVGTASLAALTAAGAGNLDGKVLVDVGNPLDSSGGMPPVLNPCNTDSLGEQIQRAFPSVRVVKTLNTVNADVMVNPGIVPGTHTMFLCGNDDAAKADVRALLESFGWGAGQLLDPRRHHRRARHGDVPPAVAAPVGRHRHRSPQHRGPARALTQPGTLRGSSP